MRVASCLFLLFAATGNAVAAHLCTGKEERVLSFETTTKKLVSLCRGEAGSYLVYRSGSAGRIDLQFPDKLDDTSWRHFAFDGRSRDGFSAHILTFLHGDAEYAIYQDSDAGQKTHDIGLQVERNGKTVAHKGIHASQEGSLHKLEEDDDKLQNTAD